MFHIAHDACGTVFTNSGGPGVSLWCLCSMRLTIVAQHLCDDHDDDDVVALSRRTPMMMMLMMMYPLRQNTFIPIPVYTNKSTYTI